MKNFGTILFVTAAALVGRAGEDARLVQANNSILITTGFISGSVAEARSTNPALKAVDSRFRSATLSAEAVRTWNDPMAIFGGSVYSSKGFKPSEDGNLAYGVEKKLPLWRKPKLNRRFAEAE